MTMSQKLETCTSMEYLHKYHLNDATVQKTGFHIDFQVFTY